MKNRDRGVSLRLLAGMLIMTTIAGCDTVNPDADDAVELTDEELEVTSRIIGESLSDEGGGLISGLYDAISDVSPSQIEYGRMEGAAKMDGERPGMRHGRGAESDFSADFNEETCEHIISFNRSFDSHLISHSLTVLSKYIFTDLEGGCLEWPKRQQDEIETIEFKGLRSGTHSGPVRTSSFIRTDTLFLAGISSASQSLMLDGNHHSEGEMAIEIRSNTFERLYSLRFEFTDVEIDKAIVEENGSLELAVTGFITYETTMKRTRNGETREKNVTGTIELADDGTALLRFKNVQRFFRISLSNGEIIED